MKTQRTAAPVRGTQLLVEHMGEVLKRPSLTCIEILWRWLVGIPFLWIGWIETQRMLAVYPLENSGFNSIDAQNPWVATAQLAGVWAYYQPHVFTVLRWLLPAGAVAWVMASALGRNLLLMKMDRRVPFRPLGMIVLQAAWMALFALTILGWLRSMQWAAAAHIFIGGEPDLIGYFIWAICLSLAFFTAFALVSWLLTVAPLLMLLERRRSAVASLGQAFRLGKGFSGKLAEINLVMGIVKLALMVLAMVFSAAPLPFSDELGPAAMHLVWAGATVFYLVANDTFQVVRLKAFVEFWKVFRGPQAGESASQP